MSFLVEDVDQLATLEVALALIDSYDDGGSSDDALVPSGADLFAGLPDATFDALVTGADVDELFVSAAVTTAAAPPRKKPAQAAPQPTKARSNAGAVARHRERKKAETQQLRSQAAELEATLAQLQQTRRTRTNALLFLLEQRRAESESKTQEIAPKLVSAWLDRAAIQAQERFKSEALNVKLKDAVAQQMQIIKSLQSILGEQNAMQGLDLLLEAQKEDLHHDFLLAQEDRVFQELRDGLKQMYFVAESLFDLKRWAEPLDSVSCTTQVKHEPVGGAFVEVRSNTPLQTGFANPAKAMWERVCCMPSGKDANYHVKKRVVTDTSFQKCYTMIIDGPDGQPLELRGVSFVEKVDEPRRMVWLWRSMLVTTDSNGPRFMEKGWTISENTGSNRGELAVRPSSVYRTCYQASCDSRGSAAAHQDSQRNALIETVLRTLGSRTRAHQQWQQNMLLDEFSGTHLPTPMIQMLA